jgi:type IV pilus assembly protein PilO
MDLKDPKAQKILLGGLIFFLIVYFWYARIYSKNARAINLKQTEYETILTDLKNVEMKAQSFENLKVEYERLLKRYQQVEQLLPEEKQIPLLLTEMHFAAQSSQTGISQIVPADVVPFEFYNASSFDIEISGSYHDFGSFLSNVANFPFLANVSQVVLSGIAQEAEVPRPRDNTVTAMFKLTTYWVQEGERLKKVEF